MLAQPGSGSTPAVPAGQGHADGGWSSSRVHLRSCACEAAGQDTRCKLQHQRSFARGDGSRTHAQHVQVRRCSFSLCVCGCECVSVSVCSAMHHLHTHTHTHTHILLLALSLTNTNTTTTTTTTNLPLCSLVYSGKAKWTCDGPSVTQRLLTPRYRLWWTVFTPSTRISSF